MRREVEHRFPKQAALRWKKNSIKIVEEKIDLEKLFKGEVDEILKRVERFYGYGPKLSRLLLRSLVDLKIIKKPVGFDEMSLPTDVHVINLAVRSGLFKEKLSANKVRKAWTEIALESGIVPADLDRALWTLGSDFCFKKKCEECPVKELCMKPVASKKN